MGELIMVTGGARSGKSSFAEKMLEGIDQVLYIATSIPFDDEMKDRVKKHRQRRLKTWETYESYKDLGSVIAKTDKKAVLLDCLTVMITNLMMEYSTDWDNVTIDKTDRVEASIKEQVDGIIQGAKVGCAKVIVVTNELGMGLVPEYKLGRVFRDIAGRMNQLVASYADEVYFVVAGIPMKIKGES